MDGSRWKKVASQVVVAVTASLVTVTLTGAGPVEAFTVPDNSVTSAKIVNDTIQSIDIKNNTIQTIDIQDGAIYTGDIADNSLQSRDILNQSIEPVDLSPSARARWAWVGTGPSPTIIAGRGAVSVSRSSPGVYDVVFVYPVGACGRTATMNFAGLGFTLAPVGFLVVVPNGQNTLRVAHFNRDGLLADPAPGEGFTVAVHC